MYYIIVTSRFRFLRFLRGIVRIGVISSLNLQVHTCSQAFMHTEPSSSNSALQVQNLQSFFRIPGPQDHSNA